MMRLIGFGMDNARKTESRLAGGFPM